MAALSLSNKQNIGQLVGYAEFQVTFYPHSSLHTVGRQSFRTTRPFQGDHEGTFRPEK